MIFVGYKIFPTVFIYIFFVGKVIIINSMKGSEMTMVFELYFCGIRIYCLLVYKKIFVKKYKMYNKRKF
jgi:hypothetical protein